MLQAPRYAYTQYLAASLDANRRVLQLLMAFGRRVALPYVQRVKRPGHDLARLGDCLVEFPLLRLEIRDVRILREWDVAFLEHALRWGERHLEDRPIAGIVLLHH